jgi:hypothetical protein
MRGHSRVWRFLSLRRAAHLLVVITEGNLRWPGARILAIYGVQLEAVSLQGVCGERWETQIPFRKRASLSLLYAPS